MLRIEQEYFLTDFRHRSYRNLPYYLQGMNIGVEQGEIVKAAETVGFIKNETDTRILCYGTQDIVVLRK